MHKKLEVPGIERIRAAVPRMLEQRQRAWAEHALPHGKANFPASISMTT